MNHNSAETNTARFFTTLLLPVALNPVNSTMIAVALPAIGLAFKVPPGTATLWLVNSYLLVNILCQSPAGKVGDLWGRGRTILLGQLFFLGGSLLAVFTPVFEGVVLARVSMAFGGALLVPSTMAILRNSLSPERRARGFGSFGAVMALSAAIGPVLGGLLLSKFSWRAIFVMNIPVLLLSLFLGWTLLKSEDTEEAKPSTTLSFDWLGTFLFVLSLGLLVWGLKFKGPYANVLVIAGVASLLSFVWWQRVATHPLIDLRLFRSLHFVAGTLSTASQYMVMYAFLFMMPFLLKHHSNVGPGKSGVILLTMTMGMVAASLIGGRLSEKIGPRFTGIIGAILGTTGASFFLTLSPQTSLTQIAVWLGCLGCGVGLCMGPNQAVAISAVPEEQSGIAAGVMSTIRYLGGLVGITILSLLLSDSSGAMKRETLQQGFWIFLSVFAFSGVLALGLPMKMQAGARKRRG